MRAAQCMACDQQHAVGRAEPTLAKRPWQAHHVGAAAAALGLIQREVDGRCRARQAIVVGLQHDVLQHPPRFGQQQRYHVGGFLQSRCLLAGQMRAQHVGEQHPAQALHTQRLSQPAGQPARFWASGGPMYWSSNRAVCSGGPKRWWASGFIHAGLRLVGGPAVVLAPRALIFRAEGDQFIQYLHARDGVRNRWPDPPLARQPLVHRFTQLGHRVCAPGLRAVEPP